MADVVIMPKLGFDMAEGTLVRWVKGEGEAINKGDVLAEIETDKATVEVESGFSGTVLRHLADEGAILPVNTPMAVVGAAGEPIDDLVAKTGGKAEKPSKEEKPESAAETQPPLVAEASKIDAEGLPGGVKASPLARRMAEEHELNLAAIDGSGPGGRIVKRDIEAALAQPKPAPTAAAPTVAPVPSFTAEAREDVTVQMTRLRQAIGRRMVEAKQQVPHFYVSHEYRVDALMEMRKQVNNLLPEGEKLSVNDFIVRAVALTLRQFPNLNASLSGDKVVQHGEINIGVAVTVEGGLLTVVCHNTDQKSLRQISIEVKTKAGKVREGKVRPEDIEGSTFSTSNLGMYDVENFTAIINPPEAAILAIGSAREVPVVENGELKPGWTMKATISVDHRVSDGAEAAQFMQALAQYLEEPLRLVV